MQKAVILVVVGDEITLPARLNPRVLLTGLPDASLDNVAAQLVAEMDAIALTGLSDEGGAVLGSLSAQAVIVEGAVEVGDTLESVSSIYRKHV